MASSDEELSLDAPAPGEELPRPVELEPYPITPPPPDERDLAEISHLTAEIDEAEKFELTFEVVDRSIAEEAEEEAKEISKIVLPVVSAPKRRSSSGSRRSGGSGRNINNEVNINRDAIQGDQNENRPRDGEVEKRPPKIFLSCDNNLDEEADDHFDYDFKENIPPKGVTPFRAVSPLMNAMKNQQSIKRTPFAELLIEEFRSSVTDGNGSGSKKRLSSENVGPLTSTPKRARI